MKTKVAFFSQKIVVIGAGNIGFHLAHAFHKTKHSIIQIYNRSEKRLLDLQAITQNLTVNLHEIIPDADVYLLAVSDDAIAKVANHLDVSPNSVVVHTSGATSLKVLHRHPRHGVFYPLQTFSRTKTVDWPTIPFCLDGNTSDVTQQLTHLSQSINNFTYFINDQQRQQLHIAAVFANNFTNHLLAIAQDILQKSDLSFDILKPLIQETVIKIQHLQPSESQTGPAVRGDVQTMEQQIRLLADFPQYQQLYKLLSNSISDLAMKKQ